MCGFKEFIQVWPVDKAPVELRPLAESGWWISYIPRDYMKDMKLDLAEQPGSKIMIKSDLKKYNGTIIACPKEIKFTLYDVEF